MNKRFALSLGALAFFLCTFSGWSETTLTLDKAVELALKQNLELGRTQVDADALKRAKDASWNVLIPSVTAQGTLSRSNEASVASGVVPVTSSLVSGSVYDQYAYFRKSASSTSVQGSLSFAISLSPATFTGMKLAVKEYEQGLLTLDGAKKSLELNVRTAFAALIVAKEQISIQEQNIDLAEKRYKQAQINHANGYVPEIDVLSAQVSLENLRPTLADYKTSYEESLGQFKILLGLDVNEPVSLSGTVEAKSIRLDAAKLIESRLGGRQDILELRKAREVLAMTKKKTSESAFSPSLGLSWSYLPRLSDPFGTSWSSGDNWSDQGVLSVSLSLSLDNFLPHSAVREKIAAAEDSLRKKDSLIDEAVQNGRLEIVNYVNKLNKSRTTLDSLEVNVKLAQRTYDLTEDAFRKGSKELLDLQDAANGLNTAKLKVLSEKYNFTTALLNLEYALNINFGTLEKQL